MAYKKPKRKLDCDLVQEIIQEIKSKNQQEKILIVDENLESIKKYTIESIADSAFKNCINLQSIEIPKIVTNIGDYAFDNCRNLKDVNIYINDNVIKISDKYENNKISSNLKGKKKSAIGDCAFRNCINLLSIKLLKMEKIGKSAFYNCEKLESIDIPNKFSEIKKYSFYNCKNLEKVSLPENITLIEKYSFSNCEKLVEVEIPIETKITEIEKFAFSNCKKLDITIPNSVTKIGDKAFQDVKNINYDGYIEGSPWGAKSLNGEEVDEL